MKQDCPRTTDRIGWKILQNGANDRTSVKSASRGALSRLRRDGHGWRHAMKRHRCAADGQGANHAAPGEELL
jgi:hypothetical protein